MNVCVDMFCCRQLVISKVECSRVDREVLILGQTDTRLLVKDRVQTRHNSLLCFQHSRICWRLLTRHSSLLYTATGTNAVTSIFIVHEVSGKGCVCLPLFLTHAYTPDFT